MHGCSSQILVIAIVYISTILLIPKNEASIFKFSNVVCESYNKSWMVIHQCRLRAVGRNKNTLNFNGTVLHPANDIGVQIQIFQKANGYKPWLVNVKMDVCRFVKKAYNPFAIVVFSLFKEFSNFNHTCPYMGEQIVSGFYLRADFLPHAIPTGEYMLAMTWHFDKRPQFITNIYYIFIEDV